MTLRERQLKTLDREIAGLEEELAKLKKNREEIKNTKDTKLSKDIKLYNFSELASIPTIQNFTVEELVNTSREELLGMRNIGKTELRKIININEIK